MNIYNTAIFYSKLNQLSMTLTNFVYFAVNDLIILQEENAFGRGHQYSLLNLMQLREKIIMLC